MRQENNPDAACMYVHPSFEIGSDRHVLGLLLCAGVIALCCAVLAVLLWILNDNILMHGTAAVHRQKKRPAKTKKGKRRLFNNNTV